MPTSLDQIAFKILTRCQNPEIDLGDAPGGYIGILVRGLDTQELQQLINGLDYHSRGEPNSDIRWKYNRVIGFLKREMDWAAKREKEQHIQHLAAKARITRKETCECGSKHPKNSNFYVSAIDGPKAILLSGPYKTHAEAVANVDKFYRLAIELDSAAAFISFGTVAMSAKHKKPGVLDHLARG